MTEPILPRSRSQANFRVIARILQLSHGQEHPSDDLLGEISDIYESKGGRWVKFFEGHPAHNKMLKVVISAVMKHKREQHERRR